MAGLVVDSSAAMSFMFNENPVKDQLWTSVMANAGAIAPAHFPVEVANSLAMAARINRVNDTFRAQSLRDMDKWSLAIEPVLDWQDLERISQIASLHKLSVYDAIYLDLAIRTGLPFATYDKELITAAKKTGVSVTP